MEKNVSLVLIIQMKYRFIIVLSLSDTTTVLEKILLGTLTKKLISKSLILIFARKVNFQDSKIKLSFLNLQNF